MFVAFVLIMFVAMEGIYPTDVHHSLLVIGHRRPPLLEDRHLLHVPHLTENLAETPQLSEVHFAEGFPGGLHITQGLHPP